MKKWLSIALIMALVLSVLTGCAPSATTTKAAGQTTQAGSTTAAPGKTQFMTFAAPPASSALYPYWVSVGKAISTVYPEYKISVSESQGAVDIMKRVRSGESNICNSVSSTDFESFTGAGTFKDQPNDKIRMLWYYEVTAEMFCVSIDSGVTKLADLNGKKFNPGGTGTSAAAISMNIFDIFGIKPEIFPAGQADAADAYANRQIVGTVKLGPTTDSYIMQLDAALPVTIINMTDEEIAKILEKYPYLIKVVVPGGTYKNIPKDVQTVGTPQGAVTTTALTQEDGYKFVKAMMEGGKSVWQAAYPTGANNDYVKLTLASSVPLHAGTVQYFKEKGIEVPAKLIPAEYKDVK